MESKYHLYIIKPNDILGSQKQEENKNFYIVLQVSQNGIPFMKEIKEVIEGYNNNKLELIGVTRGYFVDKD